MSKAIIATAREIAAEIRAQEDSVDAALAGQARLLGTLLEARRATKVPAKVGAVALDRAFEAITHGRMLRESMLAVHRELAGMNLRELAVGDVSECPEEGFGGLSLVGARDIKAA